MMKLQMAEMKELLEGKVHSLQSKLVEEKKKTETDVGQWKAMAQKELKTRLQVRTPVHKAAGDHLRNISSLLCSWNRRRRRCRRGCRR
jgi:hypothetical protein